MINLTMRATVHSTVEPNIDCYFSSFVPHNVIHCSCIFRKKSYFSRLHHKKRQHSFDIPKSFSSSNMIKAFKYVKRMLLIFHAAVKFCSTNRLFTFLDGQLSENNLPTKYNSTKSFLQDPKNCLQAPPK